MSRIAQVFWISLLVKLVLAAALPLTNDEAYYWVWAQHPQLSYYDHPPVVAWLYALGDWVRIFPGSVRWPGVLLGQAALALWLRLLQSYLNEGQRLCWLLLAVLSPLVGGSSLIVTPDLPLLFFTAAALTAYLAWRAHPEPKRALWFGLMLGCGFTSKYMMVLFALALIPLLWTDRVVRRDALRHLPLIVLGGIIGTAPVWLWNWQNDFISLKFQTDHGLGRSVWKPSWTYEYVLLQILLIFPPVLYWAVRARRNLPPVFRYLAWTPLVFFFVTTSRGYAEANWPIAAYPPLFALAASAWPAGRRAFKTTFAIWGTLFALLALIIVGQPGWSRAMKFREFHQFDGLVEAGRELSPLYARSYQMAAKLSFELRRPVYKLRGMNRRDFYDFLPESAPTAARIYLAVEKGDVVPTAYERWKVLRVFPVDDRFEIREMEAP